MFTAEEKRALEVKVSTNLLPRIKNMVQCKCGNAMEVVEGQIDFN